MPVQHNLLSDLLGVVMMPILIILAFGVMSGSKMDGLINGWLSVVGIVLKGILKLVGLMLMVFCKELGKLIEKQAKSMSSSNGIGAGTSSKKHQKIIEEVSGSDWK